MLSSHHLIFFLNQPLQLQRSVHVYLMQWLYRQQHQLAPFLMLYQSHGIINSSLLRCSYSDFVAISFGYVLHCSDHDFCLWQFWQSCRSEVIVCQGMDGWSKILHFSWTFPKMSQQTNKFLQEMFPCEPCTRV